MNRVNCIKNSTSIRKLAYIFIIICFLPLTACMSKEEREKAEKNEALARPIVQEYLNLNYGSGKIKSLDCLDSSKGDSLFPDFKDYASPYVKSSVIVDKQEFSVITNVKTGQCYDNYNELLVTEDLKNHTASSLSISAPDDIEVHYYLKDLNGRINENDYIGFTEFGVKSVDDLFKKDQYQIYVICKYIASDIDFGSVDAKRFFPATDVSGVFLALINFRSNDRYIAGDMASLDYFSFDGPQHYYSLRDVVTAYKEKKFDSVSENYIYDESFNYSYARYLSEAINGIEFAWNDFVYALDFEEVSAEKEIQTRYYSGATFYSTDEKAVSVECTSLLDDTYDINNRIYCYFDKALYNSQMLITESDDGGTDYDIWTLEWKTDNYIYQWLNTNHKNTSFTLGFYERK